MGVNDDRADARAAVAAAIERAIASGSTVVEIARAIGVSRQQVNNYRDGVHSPSLEVAVLLAAYLGVSLDRLAGVEPQPSVAPDLLDLVTDLGIAAETQASTANALQELARRAGRLAGAHETVTESG